MQAAESTGPSSYQPTAEYGTFVIGEHIRVKYGCNSPHAAPPDVVNR